MKTKLQIIIFSLLILTSYTAKSQTYNSTEVTQLQAFFAQTDGTNTNGAKMNALYDPANPVTWTGVTWDGSNPNRVITINVGSENLVGTLDLSNFTNLTSCDCSGNQLTSLSVSNNNALSSLVCQSNQLTTLDLTTNTALQILKCSNNQLTNIDLSNNVNLTIIHCSNNNLISLDVTKNKALTDLDCDANNISTLNVANNTFLQSLNFSGNNISTIDVTKNTNLQTLICSVNKLMSLDLTQNKALSFLDCSLNKIQSLDVSGSPLTYFECSKNKLKSIDISKNTLLTTFFCTHNLLTSLDVTKNMMLQHFKCTNNELKFSDIKHSSTVIDSNSLLQRPFIPKGVDTLAGTMAIALGGTINLIGENNINAVIGNTANATTFHIWKKASSGLITEVTLYCSINLGAIQLPSSANQGDSIFITMSNPTYPQFVEQTTSATALSSGMRTRTFALVGGAFLPIELLSFTATLNNNKVDLAWSTASEKNNAFFTVERSLNNKDWESVAKVDGAGNSNTQLNYSTIDENPLSGVSYYRLKQTDFDGKFEYSKTVVINRNAKTAIQLYPNPATDQLSVIGNEDDLNSIKIYNSLGQDVTKYTNYSSSNTKQISVDISKLTTGIYILKTKNTTNRLVVK